ncbi:uncharacterized protein LOC143427232 [Xylocopa sonorina]|uniref:uncharacterized protein LOC143427232 n=1 Tax=Xylocopa sonorina TaxID=1818115 RepID=UPI00403AF87D
MRKVIGGTSCRKLKPISVEKNKSKLYSDKSTSKYPHSEISSSLKRCSRFPLYALHTVNCILNSKCQRSHNEYELKGPLGMYLFETMEQRALKLMDFFTQVEERYRENEQAKLHHRPKVNNGTLDVNENGIIEIKAQREQAWNDYKNLITHSEEEIFERVKCKKIRQRILRASQENSATFSTPSRNAESIIHYRKIQPFVQAARKIILRNRLVKVLEKLRKLTPELVIQFEQPLVSNYFSTLCEFKE